MFSTNPVLVSGKFRDGLGEADRALFDKCLQDAIDYNWKISEEADNEAKKFLLDKGLNITVPTAEMRAQMKASLANFYEWFYTEVPGSKEIIAEMENTPK
jgi:TRAP-type C4-dicarboxylate transport system substrate-binding protein